MLSSAITARCGHREHGKNPGESAFDHQHTFTHTTMFRVLLSLIGLIATVSAQCSTNNGCQACIDDSPHNCFCTSTIAGQVARYCFTIFARASFPRVAYDRVLRVEPVHDDRDRSIKVPRRELRVRPLRFKLRLPPVRLRERYMLPGNVDHIIRRRRLLPDPGADDDGRVSVPRA